MEDNMRKLYDFFVTGDYIDGDGNKKHADPQPVKAKKILDIKDKAGNFRYSHFAEKSKKSKKE